MMEHARTGSIRSTIIRASAGTGKTQRLATRYLQLLDAGVDPRSILAVTFTRKAAGEIFARVVDRLATAALDPSELSRLGADLQQPDFDRGRCLDLLLALTERIHEVKVGTLDSYFYQQLLGGAGAGPRMTMRSIADTSAIERLRTDTIAALLHDHSADLTPLIHWLAHGSASRGIVALVEDVVAEVYQLYLESARCGRDAWTLAVPGGRMNAESFAQAIANLEDVADLSASFTSARNDAVECLQREDWAWFLTNGIAPKIRDGGTYYRQSIPPALDAAYRPLIAHAIACLAAQWSDFTRAAHELLCAFDREYERAKLRTQLATFDDLPRYLTGSLGPNDTTLVSSWDDPSIDHLLLDEFQDTSLSQWRALEGMARRTSDGSPASLLCVGDAKQSIYGWRGGVPELLTSLPTLLPGAVPEDLVKSYRSSPVIIDLVNRIFGEVPPFPGKDIYQHAIQDWWRTFKEHTTERDYDGHATLRTAKKSTREELVQTACDVVEEIRHSHPGATIAVLVVKNDEVADTIYQLRQRGIDASEEGGQSLTDSAAVCLLLSMLQLADHPGDSVARFHLAHSPLADGITLEPKKRGSNAAMDAATRDWRQRLYRDGLGPTLESWSKPLSEHCSDSEWRRVQHLIRHAETWDREGWTSLTDFIRFIKTERVGQPIASATRVMTVHRAKGLQFDVVVFFGLDGNFIAPPKYAYARDPATLEINHIMPYVDQEIQTMLPTEWQSITQNMLERLVKERLCVLYVGVTRAIHALHLIMKPVESKSGTNNSLAGLVHAALAPATPATPDTVLFEIGRSDWRLARADAKGDPYVSAILERTTETADQPHSRTTITPWPRRASRPATFQSPSSLEGDATVAVAGHFQRQRQDAFQFGSLVHGILETIEWLEENDALSLRIEQALSKANVDTARYPELRSQLAHWLNTDAVRQILVRDRYTKSLPREVQDRMKQDSFRLEVRAEQSVVARGSCDGTDSAMEPNVLGAGIIDRLILGLENDIPVWVHIIDYKTDRIAMEDLASRCAFYQPQLAAYRNLIAKALAVPSSLPRADLCFLAIGALVPVP